VRVGIGYEVAGRGQDRQRLGAVLAARTMTASYSTEGPPPIFWSAGTRWPSLVSI